MRATSPKVPKLKTNGTSRASSPLASPVGSPPTRAESPPGQSPTISPSSPPAGGIAKPSNKRKAEDGSTNGGGAAKPKKRKGHAGGASVEGELQDWMLVEWLKQTPNATTRDCIHHFTPYLTDEDKKQNFTKLVKEVAQLKGGVLVLRNAYRGTASSATTPAPGSPAANGAAE
jgi:transcription initiation factor TFIIF subunit alpha